MLLNRTLEEAIPRGRAKAVAADMERDVSLIQKKRRGECLSEIDSLKRLMRAVHDADPDGCGVDWILEDLQNYADILKAAHIVHRGVTFQQLSSEAHKEAYEALLAIQQCAHPKIIEKETIEAKGRFRSLLVYLYLRSRHHRHRRLLQEAITMKATVQVNTETPKQVTDLESLSTEIRRGLTSGRPVQIKIKALEPTAPPKAA